MWIVRAGPGDLDRIDPLRRALWPDSPIEELKKQTDAILAGSYLVLVANADDGAPIGFAEVAVRTDYVNGCDSSPVGFLEGIYVAPAWRERGIGRALVDAATTWAGKRGAAEFASDALLDNTASHAFHRAVGFEETERVVYFRRVICEAAA